jgi:stage V sporulation protein AE
MIMREVKLVNDYVMAFIVGGFICAIAQILMDKTKLTPARILVIFVTLGVFLGGFRIYDVLIEYGKAGATIPLPGFGYSLAKSTMDEVDNVGLIGAFTGGIKGTAGGITAAIFFGYIMAMLFNPKTK